MQFNGMRPPDHCSRSSKELCLPHSRLLAASKQQGWSSLSCWQNRYPALGSYPFVSECQKKGMQCSLVNSNWVVSALEQCICLPAKQCSLKIKTADHSQSIPENAGVVTVQKLARQRTCSERGLYKPRKLQGCACT